MKVAWWGCVLAVLCMSTEVKLQDWTVSQRPLSITFTSVNSSTEISCSTSLSNPVGLYLERQYHINKRVAYLSLKDGRVTKKTTAYQIDVTSDHRVTDGVGITLRLLQLGPVDTDLYYCTWTHLISRTATLEKRSSNGTVIIVRDSRNPCKHQTLELTMIGLIAAAFTSILILISGVLICQCTKFKRNLRLSGTIKPSRPNNPPNPCIHHMVQCNPYMVTTEEHVNYRDFL